MNEKEFTDLQVILVEPSHTQQIIIKQYFTDLGITDIHSIESGKKALMCLQKGTADLIVSSMYLPDMTGSELLHTIRKGTDCADIAFILISSETNINYLDPIRQAGAIAILPKPFSVKELDVAFSSTLDYLNPQQIELEHLDIEDISVLIVDDSPLSLKYISKILNNIGIDQITCASGGKQALDIIESQYYDLIITDYNMPEMDGVELTTAIRSKSNQKTIPIVMVTSERNENRLCAVERAGFSAILDKPFEQKTIRDLIIHLLN